MVYEMEWNEMVLTGPVRFPEFFSLLYAIAKIALITSKIIASLENALYKEF